MLDYMNISAGGDIPEVSAAKDKSFLNDTPKKTSKDD